MDIFQIIIVIKLYEYTQYAVRTPKRFQIRVPCRVEYMAGVTLQRNMLAARLELQAAVWSLSPAIHGRTPWTAESSFVIQFYTSAARKIVA